MADEKPKNLIVLRGFWDKESRHVAGDILAPGDITESVAREMIGTGHVGPTDKKPVKVDRKKIHNKAEGLPG